MKIIALSAFPASMLDVEARLDGYLTKPIDPSDLVKAIARAVER